MTDSMAFDPVLADAMRAALERRRNIVETKMFGGYCWMLKGNMLCGVEVGRNVFRVGKAQAAEALSRPGARPMDITGKPVAGFVCGMHGPTVRQGISRARAPRRRRVEESW